MKRSIQLFLLVAVLIVAAIPAAAQTPTSISGSWTFTLELSTGSVSFQADISGEDNALQGTMTGASGAFNIAGACSATSVRIYATAADSDVRFVFNGAPGAGTMSGTLEVDGTETGKWSAKRN